MKFFPGVLGSLMQRTLLSLSAVVGSSVVLASAPPANDQLRADCRSEGQVAGLQGVELERFVRECIAEFLEVELVNLEE